TPLARQDCYAPRTTQTPSGHHERARHSIARRDAPLDRPYRDPATPAGAPGTSLHPSGTHRARPSRPTVPSPEPIQTAGSPLGYATAANCAVSAVMIEISSGVRPFGRAA